MKEDLKADVVVLNLRGVTSGRISSDKPNDPEFLAAEARLINCPSCNTKQPFLYDGARDAFTEVNPNRCSSCGYQPENAVQDALFLDAIKDEVGRRRVIRQFNIRLKKSNDPFLHKVALLLQQDSEKRKSETFAKLYGRAGEDRRTVEDRLNAKLKELIQRLELQETIWSGSAAAENEAMAEEIAKRVGAVPPKEESEVHKIWNPCSEIAIDKKTQEFKEEPFLRVAAKVEAFHKALALDLLGVPKRIEQDPDAQLLGALHLVVCESLGREPTFEEFSEFHKAMHHDASSRQAVQSVIDTAAPHILSESFRKVASLGSFHDQKKKVDIKLLASVDEDSLMTRSPRLY